MKNEHVVALVTAASCVGLVVLPVVAKDAASPPAPAVAKDAGSPPDPNIVRVSIRTIPEVRAEVWWGKKELGKTPLSFERPRDSGPMDLVLTAPGYLTVRTRAYTFSDDKLHVNMTRVQDAHLIFGFRHELVKPPDGGVPDGGAADGGTGGSAAGAGTGGGAGSGGRPASDGGTRH